MKVSNIITNNKFIFIYLVFILLFVLFSFSSDNYTYFKSELGLISILTVLSCLLIFYSFKRKWDLHKIAFLIILIFGVLMVFLAPPMAFPDECTHFTRAELMTEGQLYPEATDNGYYVNDYYFILDTAPLSGLTFLDSADFYGPVDDSKGYWPVSTQSPFYSYIFSALGILFAKFLDLPIIAVLWISRLFNLMFYAVVFAYLVKITNKEFKIPLLVLGTMPLLMAQVCSLSYDSFILTFAMVIITYLVKMYNEGIKNSYLVIFLLSCLLISLIKPPYILLGLTIFIIPKKRLLENKKQFYAIIGILAIIFLAVILSFGGLLNNLFASHAVTVVKTTFSQSYDISLQGQIDFILNNPLILVDLIAFIIKSIPSLFILDLNFFHYGGFNGTKFLTILYFIFFFAVSIFYCNKVNLSKLKRIYLAVLFLIVYLGFYFIQYLQWTPVGSNIILGVQARYFLPILLLIPLILNLKNDKLKIKDLDHLIITLVIVFLSGLLILTISHYY